MSVAERISDGWRYEIYGRPLAFVGAFADRTGLGGIYGGCVGRRWDRLAGRLGGVAQGCWIAGTVLAVVPALVWVLVALRRGRVGVDVIAVLSLVGTLLVGEYLAGALIAVMLAGGRALDSAAERRASRDLRALLERAPRFARRRVGTQVSVIPLAEVAANDVLVVGPGEVVPVDGRVADVVAVLDESALTGEPLQVERGVGGPVRSGVVNAGSAFELRATATADESTYAGIVRLAQQAGAENAPIVRLADRYAAWFLPLALLLAGAAWLASGSAVRAVAVLVVATPCPLLLAAPVAIVSGLSRASRAGVVIRGGGVLENLGHATTLVMDKTGTLTMGRPVVVDVVAAPGRDATAMLRLAASVDQLSPHVLAEAIVTEALNRGLRLSLPTGVAEQPGRGVTASIDGCRVTTPRQSPSQAIPPAANAPTVNTTKAGSISERTHESQRLAADFVSSTIRNPFGHNRGEFVSRGLGRHRPLRSGRRKLLHPRRGRPRERRNTTPAKATRNHGRSDDILTNWCAAKLVVNPRIPSTPSVSRFIPLLGLFPCFFSGHKCVIHWRVGQQPVSVELQGRQNRVLAVVPQHRFHIGRVVVHVPYIDVSVSSP